MEEAKEFSFPFDAALDEQTGEPDRLYKMSDFASERELFFVNGVFPNPSSGLQVDAIDGNMTITVRQGSAFINGRAYRLVNADKKIIVDPANNVNARIDIVTVRLDEINRTITAKYIKGTPATNPVAPAIIRTSDMWELKLAEITVVSNATLITQANILSTRLDKNVCGIAHAVIEQVDTTDIFNQYLTALNEFLGLAEIKTAEILALIGGLQTQTFAITRASFDANWDKLGCERTTEIIRDVNGITSSSEKITVIIDNFVLATRDTTITRVNGVISSSVSSETWNSYQFVQGLITTVIPNLVFGVTTDITRIDGEITSSKEVIL